MESKTIKILCITLVLIYFTAIFGACVSPDAPANAPADHKGHQIHYIGPDKKSKLLIVDEDTEELLTGNELPKVATEWSYEGKTGPVYWAKLRPGCAGKRQSPINIVKRNVVVNATLGNLTVINYDSKPIGNTWVVINNGHTAEISAVFPPGKIPTIIGGGLLPPGYVFRQIHLHWGHGHNPGSEHLIEFRRLHAELHIVHMRKDFVSDNGLVNDLYDRDGTSVAVLGILLDIGHDDNPAFEPVIRALNSVKEYNTSARIQGLDLMKLLPNNAKTSDDLAFYRYLGSLTTPNCIEIVIWTVLQRTVLISERQADQLELLKGAHGEDHIIDNYRYVQSLGGRVVYANRLVDHGA